MQVVSLLHACVITPWALSALFRLEDRMMVCGDIGHSRMLLFAGSFAVYEMMYTVFLRKGGYVERALWLAHGMIMWVASVVPVMYGIARVQELMCFLLLYECSTICLCGRRLGILGGKVGTYGFALTFVMIRMIIGIPVVVVHVYGMLTGGFVECETLWVVVCDVVLNASQCALNGHWTYKLWVHMRRAGVSRVGHIRSRRQ